jgi:predicted transcriptional regulator
MASAYRSYKNVEEIPQHVLKQMDELKQIQLAIFAEAENHLILVGYPSS